MVVFSGFDERRVDVDTDDVVTGRGQEAADPARATTSVEDARAAGTSASTRRASPAKSAPSRAIERKRSIYHCEWFGSAATFCIQRLCSTMQPLSQEADLPAQAARTHVRNGTQRPDRGANLEPTRR
ncbi:Uncharacterised protein [Mycobacteroides abscessus]|nr:Uncharacterised protein [Mycobacteroides abscessus]